MAKKTTQKYTLKNSDISTSLAKGKRRPSTMTPDHFIEARKALGLTQQELADLADTGRASITRMETGRMGISGLWKLAMELMLKEQRTIKALEELKADIKN